MVTLKVTLKYMIPKESYQVTKVTTKNRHPHDVRAYVRACAHMSVYTQICRYMVTFIYIIIIIFIYII